MKTSPRTPALAAKRAGSATSGAAEIGGVVPGQAYDGYVDAQSDPDERFDQVESTLNQLANSQRHLLTAQVLLNDRMERAETAIQKLAETMLAVADGQKRTDEKLAALTDKVDTLTDKVDTLTDIIQRWYERHGNGSSGQHQS